MNLFVLGYGLQDHQADLIAPALQETASLFATLNEGSVYAWKSKCRSLALACHTPTKELRGARQYVAESDDVVVAYDGLPVDCTDQSSPHIASELLQCWDDSIDDLDGFFCGIRILKQKLQLEVQFDSFGVHPIYYRNAGDSWLISNSVALLDQMTGQTELDSVGVARMLAMGWVAGQRTLREGVRVFPAGERWTWSKSGTSPTRVQTARQCAISDRKSSSLSLAGTMRLSDELARPLKSLGRDLGNLACPLTGGKDSRMLAALLSNNNVPARYYTYGNKVGVDGEIAGKVASELGITHENLLTESTELLSNWDAEVEKFILQGDGMSPVQMVMSTSVAEAVMTQPLAVRIAGGGGALGRGQYFNPIHEFRGNTVSAVKQNIAQRFVSSSDGMVRPEAVALAREFTDQTIADYADQGFHVDDLSDVFYLYERGGRRTGEVMHTTRHLRDSYSPYFSRALVEAIFSLPIRTRRTEAIHYQLIQALAPSLLQIPCESGPWKPRSPRLNYYRELSQQVQRRLRARVPRWIPQKKPASNAHFIVKDTTFERVRWLQQIKGNLRDMCMDSPNSIIWDFVDRAKFEHAMTSTDTLSQFARPLFLTATIHYYDTLSRRLRPHGAAGISAAR